MRSRHDLERPTLTRRLEEILAAEPVSPRVERFHDENLARARMAEWEGERIFCRLPAVSKDEFWQRTSAREIFPTKTTYFEPKICTGIVSRMLREETR